MSFHLGQRRIVLCALLALAAGLAGCGRNAARVDAAPQASHDSNASNASNASSKADALFTIPQAQMAHLSVVTVQPGTLVRNLRLPGTVAYNGFHTTPVITQVGGPVTRILAEPGQQVRPGQPLLYVSSPDFAAARASYLKAQDAYQLADKNFRRAQDLYEHSAIAQKDLQQASSARAQAQADVQSATAALRVLGVADPSSVAKGAPSEIPVRAPIAGQIVERQVAPGQVLQANATQCFTISDMSTVWVLVNVYEDDLGYVHRGEEAEIRAEAYPGSFHGRISYLGATLDPASRTLQARIVVRNPGGKLKNQMYVTALVRAGQMTHVIAVPDAAVLHDEVNQPFVYAATAQPRQFARRAVTVGESEGGKTRILSGLQAGDRIIGDGSLFVQFANSQR